MIKMSSTERRSDINETTKETSKSYLDNYINYKLPKASRNFFEKLNT